MHNFIKTIFLTKSLVSWGATGNDLGAYFFGYNACDNSQPRHLAFELQALWAQIALIMVESPFL